MKIISGLFKKHDNLMCWRCLTSEVNFFVFDILIKKIKIFSFQDRKYSHKDIVESIKFEGIPSARLRC